MPKSNSLRAAFTLIEVMVAVLIVSVVIAALLSMQGSASNSLFELKKMMHTTQYGSLLLEQSDKYGFENSRADLGRLVEDFELESDLRRRLGAIPLELRYEAVDLIDTAELSDEVVKEANLTNAQNGGAVVLEIGKTQLSSELFNIAVLRVRLQ